MLTHLKYLMECRTRTDEIALYYINHKISGKVHDLKCSKKDERGKASLESENNPP